MRGIALIVVTLGTFTALGQTTPKDPDVVQALLAEVRQLRHDIEGMTVASQRVQIALYRLQIQDATVSRAAQRVDETRGKRIDAESARDRTAAEVQKLEASLSSGTLKEAETKEVQQRLAQLKFELERWTEPVQSAQAAEAEAASVYRTEQVKLVEIQDRVDRLDKVLETMGGGGK
jgi:chromosome segregation ATPase